MPHLWMEKSGLVSHLESMIDLQQEHQEMEALEEDVCVLSLSVFT